MSSSFRRQFSRSRAALQSITKKFAMEMLLVTMRLLLIQFPLLATLVVMSDLQKEMKQTTQTAAEPTMKHATIVRP